MSRHNLVCTVQNSNFGSESRGTTLAVKGKQRLPGNLCFCFGICKKTSIVMMQLIFFYLTELVTNIGMF